MTEPLAVLGGITAEQFLAEYWQKKNLYWYVTGCQKLSVF